eukprot:4711058-Pleurochrysis_carterae.AAC.1
MVETSTLVEDCTANVFWYERAISTSEVKLLNECQRVNMIPGAGTFRRYRRCVLLDNSSCMLSRLLPEKHIGLATKLRGSRSCGSKNCIVDMVSVHEAFNLQRASGRNAGELAEDCDSRPLLDLCALPCAGMHEMARKSSLARALNRMRRLYPNDFDFFPATWNLPAQLDEFKREHAARAKAGAPSECTQSMQHHRAHSAASFSGLANVHACERVGARASALSDAC